MAEDDPKPQTKVFHLPFEVPVEFGEPVTWVTIAINPKGDTYLRAPLDTHPDLALALAGEAASIICRSVAQRLRSALLAERVMQASEEEPAMTQGRA